MITVFKATQGCLLGLNARGGPLFFLCESIQSNFHYAVIVGGADMVIQDWTAW